MDLQDNIVVTIQNSKTVYTIEDIINSDILFEFKESDYVRIDNNIQDYVLSFETEEETKTGDFFHPVSFGFNIVLNFNESNKCTMPYKIELTHKKTGQKIYSYYNVLPLTSLGSKGFLDMVNYIGQYNTRICFDSLSVKPLNGRKDRTKFSQSSLSLARQISDNTNKIIMSLNGGLSTLESLGDVLVYTRKIKKINEKTIIKSLINNKENDKMYSLQKTLIADKENYRNLYKMLSISLQNVKKLLDWCKSTIDKINHDIVFTTSKYGENYHAKWYKNYLITSYNKIKELQDISNNINKVLKAILAIYNRFPNEYKTNASYFIPNKDFLSNQNLNDLYKTLYEPFLGFRFSAFKNYRDILSYPLFKSAKIFELFTLIKLMECIEDSGFIMNGLSISELDAMDVSKELTLSFNNNDLRLELNYDLPLSTDVKSYNDNELICMGGMNNRPDFTIAIFDSENNPIYLMVVDAKCKQFETMKDKMGIYTIIDYSSIRCFKNSFLQSKTVDDLIFVSPMFDEFKIDQDNVYGASFINASLNNRYDQFHNLIVSKIGDKI